MYAQCIFFMHCINFSRLKNIPHYVERIIWYCFLPGAWRLFAPKPTGTCAQYKRAYKKIGCGEETLKTRRKETAPSNVSPLAAQKAPQHFFRARRNVLRTSKYVLRIHVLSRGNSFVGETAQRLKCALNNIYQYTVPNNDIRVMPDLHPCCALD